MTKIAISKPLRPADRGEDAVEADGKTVGELLADLSARYPGLRPHLFNADGKLRSFVNIYLNDDDIRYLQREQTPVGSGDTLSIIPSIAGGPGTSIDIPGALPRQAFIDVAVADSRISEQAIAVLETCIVTFMNELGFELLSSEPPIRGSWFRRFFFESKKALTSPEAHQLYADGKEALRRQVIDLPGAEADLNLATAAQRLITSIEPFDNVAIRLGDILLVKFTIRGQTTLVIEKIANEIARELENDPALLRDPKALLRFLDVRRSSGTEAIASTAERRP